MATYDKAMEHAQALAKETSESYFIFHQPETGVSRSVPVCWQAMFWAAKGGQCECVSRGRRRSGMKKDLVLHNMI